jgi:Helix-turn-helix domain
MKRVRSTPPPPLPRSRPPISERKAAEAIGLSPSYMRQLRNRGAGPPYLRFGKAVRIRPDDLDAWAEAHRVEPNE